MPIAPLTLQENYWEDFQIQDFDLEYLYNYLLEKETPQTSIELAQVLVEERIRIEKQKLEDKQKEGGDLYLPKNHYQAGQSLVFPALNWQRGVILSVRPGQNPEYEPFEVIKVRFDNGDEREYAAGLQDHALNTPVLVNTSAPELNPAHVLKKYGKEIARKVTEEFTANEDLVRIAGRWFPRSLLVDVNIGYLNLAEAVLEMAGGGPLTTQQILEQIELPTDTNPNLTQFSLNLALQEDDRFDEVGPAGEILWYLKRLEPEGVRSIPPTLNYVPVDINPKELGDALYELESLVTDEHELTADQPEETDHVTLSLIYPHWRAGTLPITTQLRGFFPTAYESPRIQFSFRDKESGKLYDGWVVRSHNYIIGLRDWYLEKDLLPGSLVTIYHSDRPGEVIIHAHTKRLTKEWVRTVLIGNDGGVVFAMLKQPMACEYDERMVIAVPDPDALDRVWESPARSRQSLEQAVMNTMRELAKLNPQGQVHAQELYAAVNISRRCPPAPILAYLARNPKVTHLGDLYFRIDES